MTFSTTSISGAKAWQAGRKLEENPWVVGSNQHREWARGWKEASGGRVTERLVSNGPSHTERHT